MAPYLNRRDFIAGTASLVAVIGALRARGATAATRVSRSVRGPYGPLRPVADLETGLPLIQLPEGFQYRTYSWAGDPMSNGEPTPAAHDGMGVVSSLRRDDETELVLVRNHERAIGTPIRAPARYDAASPSGQGSGPAGGTTTLRFRGRRWIGVEPSLGGTIYNCAGGVTPWGTWLSCEETTIDLSAAGGRPHGYVFEVRQEASATTGRPIVAMGRMRHEAIAVDPRTGAVYLTEDEDMSRCSGFYRFLPSNTSGRPGSLEAGGRLQMARVARQANADLATPRVGDKYAIEWIDIEDADAAPGAAPAELVRDAGIIGSLLRTSGPFLDGWSRGALRMSRGEGICHHGGRIFLVDTAAGADANGRRGYGEGAVWAFDPATESLEAIFVAGSAQVGDNIDNITVSPRGGILLCEDGDTLTDEYGPGTRLLGLTADGDSYPFAKNNVSLTIEQVVSAGKRIVPGDYRMDEWAGACFDPNGETLFINIQRPGITFAIWGPWEEGNL